MNNNRVCVICLGSNLEACSHLTEARNVLERLFPDVVFGEQIDTPAEGVVGQADYVNVAARFTTQLTAEQVVWRLKQIEKENGRRPEDKQSGRIPLDIDLLMYGDQILKPQDMEKDYVRLAFQSL